MLTLSDFKERVQEFCTMYVSEYLPDYTISYECEDDVFTAEIVCDDDRDVKWIIPIMVSDYVDDIAINIGDAGELIANDAGLYSFLWNTSVSQYRELQYDMEALQKRNDHLEQYVERGTCIFCGGNEMELPDNLPKDLS